MPDFSFHSLFSSSSSPQSQPCYNDALDSSHGGFGEDEDSQAEWGLSLASILSDHSSASGSGLAVILGGTINSYIDEAWKCSTGVGGCSGPVPYPLPGFDPSQCSWKAHVQCPQMNLWRKSLCGFYTPATYDSYSNQGWYGLLRVSPQAGDVDKLTPRLIYGRLQQLWSPSQQHAWVWVLMLALALFVAVGLTVRTQTEFIKRRAQVTEIEARSSAKNSARGRSPLGVFHQSSGGSNSGSGGNGVSGVGTVSTTGSYNSSPSGTGATNVSGGSGSGDKRGVVRGPAGKSSRAAGGVSASVGQASPSSLAGMAGAAGMGSASNTPLMKSSSPAFLNTPYTSTAATGGSGGASASPARVSSTSASPATVQSTIADQSGPVRPHEDESKVKDPELHRMEDKGR